MRGGSLCLALALVPLQQDRPADQELRRQAQELLDRADARQATGWDLVRAEVDLALQADAGSFHGTATLQLRATVPTNEIVLILCAEEVRQVAGADGTALPHSFEHPRVVVSLPEEAAARSTVTVRVEYVTGKEQGFVQGVAPPGPQGASAWLPVTVAGMDQATLAVDLVVPTGLTTLAPGVLHASTHEGKLRRDQWRLDVPTAMDDWYLLTGTQERVDLGQVGERQLAAVAPASLAARAKQWLTPTGQALEVLERRFGSDCPLPSFTVVLVEDLPAPVLPGAGAVFLLSETLTQDLPGERARFGALIPFLARAWWGVQERGSGPQDRWLIEGLAAYAEVLVQEELGFPDEALVRLRDLQEQAVTAWRDRPWSLGGREDRGATAAELAAGGAAALHLLRQTIGDQAFFTALAGLGGNRAEQPATTRTFLSLAKVHSEQDLEPWAARWLQSSGLPDVVGRWSFDAAAQELELQLQQVQAASGPADLGMDLVVACQGSFGRRRFRVPLDGRSVEVRVPCPDRPDFVSWNEGLGLALFTGTQPDHEDWSRALRDEADPVGRWQAARALGDPQATGPELTVADLAALSRAACEDPSPWVRAQAMRSMGRSPEPVVLSACKTVLLDGDTRVRVAAARTLGRQKGVGGAVGLLLDRLGSESEVEVQALLVAQVAATQVPETDTVLGQIADAEGLPEVVRGAALRALIPADPAGSLRRARRFLDGGPLLRRAAREALAELHATGADVGRLFGRQLEQPLLEEQHHTLVLLAGLRDPGHLPRLVRYHEQCPFEGLRQRARGLIRTLLIQDNQAGRSP